MKVEYVDTEYKSAYVKLWDEWYIKIDLTQENKNYTTTWRRNRADQLARGKIIKFGITREHFNDFTVYARLVTIRFDRTFDKEDINIVFPYIILNEEQAVEEIL